MANNASRRATVVRSEIVGIALLTLAFFVAISLISFYLSIHGKPTRWGGVLGYKLSETLYLLIGNTGYTIPVLILVFAIESLRKSVLSSWLPKAVAVCIFILTLSGLFSLSMGDESIQGGIMGQQLGLYLTFYLGWTGTFSLLLALCVIAFILLTGITVSTVLKVAIISSRKFYITVAYLLHFSRLIKRPRKKGRRKTSTISPNIITPQKEQGARKKAAAHQHQLDFLSPSGSFQLPQTSLLDSREQQKSLNRESILTSSRILEKKLKDFDVEGRILEVRPGPVVTTYEFEPAPGVKVGKIVNLADDLALAMRASSIRILAPVPGKAVVGIEIPNPGRETIYLREILENAAYVKNKGSLTLAFGKDIGGTPYVADLARMPHLLIAGATGSGKSVFINDLILSILYKATPEDVRFLMIDPKMLELSPYEGIPHLLTPVVTDPKKASLTLKSIVGEMTRRYHLMSEIGGKNIDAYNSALIRPSKRPPDSNEDNPPRHTHLPYIVVVIDELSDLMMASGKDVEASLVRLSQMARAAGIHLILATQRPSVDVITGLIKSNFPARISLQVPSKIDSRTILDCMGAESLLGDGDMLFVPQGSSQPLRIHGAYVSDVEIKRVTRFLRKQGKPSYDRSLTELKAVEKLSDERDDEHDEDFIRKFDQAVKLASSLDMISASYIQRRFRVGYNTAARIIEKMESEGIVGPPQGSKPREVLIRK